MPTAAMRNTWTALKVLLARLRFLAVFLAAFLIVGYWDTARNYLDKWTRPAAVADEGSPYEYYCRMHPTVVLSHPGICPVAGCGMPLIQRRKGGKIILPEDVLARVQLTPSRIALANIETSLVEERALVREIRTVGMLDYDETRVAQISSRVAGRADELFVKSNGQTVKRGDPLYSLYSPEVYTAQREYLLARKRVNELPGEADADLRHDASEVYNAAMQKLVLWGATTEELDRLDQEFDRTGKVPTHFTVPSPISGIVLRKSLYEGGYVQAGDSPFTVADLTNLWLLARIYEQDVPLVSLGDRVEIHIDSLPNETFIGKITFLAYAIDPVTRTLAARVEVANPDLRLKPGMFADAMIRVPILPGVTPTTTPTATQQHADEAARRFQAALQPYLAAQQTLAQGKTDGVVANIRDSVALLGGLSDRAEYKPHIDVIAALARDLPTAANLATVRETFRNISNELIPLGKAVGMPAESPTIRVFHCPMGKKPNWLALGSDTVNPYMGPEMVTCGSPVESLPKTAPVVAMRPVASGSRVLAIPRSAVIDTGSRKIVFVANPQIEGAFDMRAVVLGPLAKEDYPVLSGLDAGDKVVTVGAFLLDAENRLNPTEEPNHEDAKPTKTHEEQRQ